MLGVDPRNSDDAVFFIRLIEGRVKAVVFLATDPMAR